MCVYTIQSTDLLGTDEIDEAGGGSIFLKGLYCRAFMLNELYFTQECIEKCNDSIITFNFLSIDKTSPSNPMFVQELQPAGKHIP